GFEASRLLADAVAMMEMSHGRERRPSDDAPRNRARRTVGHFARRAGFHRPADRVPGPPGARRADVDVCAAAPPDLPTANRGVEPRSSAARQFVALEFVGDRATHALLVSGG